MNLTEKLNLRGYSKDESKQLKSIDEVAEFTERRKKDSVAMHQKNRIRKKILSFVYDRRELYSSGDYECGTKSRE